MPIVLTGASVALDGWLSVLANLVGQLGEYLLGHRVDLIQRADCCGQGIQGDGLLDRFAISFPALP